jgi:hypothetical protein
VTLALVRLADDMKGPKRPEALNRMRALLRKRVT